MRVISKNIRYATTEPFEGEELWSVRKDYLVSELRFNSLHDESALLCCQEVLHEQLEDILQGLRQLDSWDSIGWGRDDGKEAGEYSPIFFRPAVWQIIESEPIWLSPTPDIPSKDPDAGSIRILTRAKLKHISTEFIVVVYCTHLDNVSSDARKRAADQICGIARNDIQLPIILAGDFNSEDTQEAYQTITQSGIFHDIGSSSSGYKYGNSHTFTGFGTKDDVPIKIDYIFYSNPATSEGNPYFTVQNYAVLSNVFEDGVYNSDHRAVVADVVLCSSQPCLVDRHEDFSRQ